MRGILMSGAVAAVMILAAVNTYCGHEHGKDQTCDKEKEKVEGAGGHHHFMGGPEEHKCVGKEAIVLQDSGKDIRVTWADVEKAHGHKCLGSTLGFRSVMVALEKLCAGGTPPDRKDIRVLSGMSPCSQDAISFILDIPSHSGDMKAGGGGKIGFEGIRKSVFQIKSTGKAMAVVLKEGIIPEEFWKLFSNRMSLAGEERQKFGSLMMETSNKILSLSAEELFEINPVEGNIFESAVK